MHSGNPNATGQFVVYQHVFHLAGYVHKAEETDFLALSGQVAMEGSTRRGSTTSTREASTSRPGLPSKCATLLATYLSDKAVC